MRWGCFSDQSTLKSHEGVLVPIWVGWYFGYLNSSWVQAPQFALFISVLWIYVRFVENRRRMCIILSYRTSRMEIRKRDAGLLFTALKYVLIMKVTLWTATFFAILECWICLSLDKRFACLMNLFKTSVLATVFAHNTCIIETCKWLMWNAGCLSSAAVAGQTHVCLQLRRNGTRYRCSHIISLGSRPEYKGNMFEASCFCYHSNEVERTNLWLIRELVSIENSTATIWKEMVMNLLFTLKFSTLSKTSNMAFLSSNST